MSWLLRKIILLAFWGMVTFSALLAVSSLGAGKILPYLDHYRPQIERNLEQITGYPITLKSIDGRLEGIDPTVSVSGFQLSPNGKDAIFVEEMRIRIDTIKSLLSLSPQFTYIRFLNPVVSLEETDDQWRLNGARITKTVDNDVGIERALDYLSAQRNFSILNAKINVYSQRLGDHKIHIPHLYIFQKAFGSLLQSTFYLDDYKEPFEIRSRVDKTSLVVGGYRVKTELHSPLITIPVSEIFPSNPFSLSSVEFGGDAWLDVLVDSEIALQTHDTALDFTFSDGKRYRSRSALKLNYSYQKPKLHLDVHNLELQSQGQSDYPLSNIAFDWSSVTNRSTIRYDRIDLSFLYQIADYCLPENSSAKEMLNALSPEGVAKNGRLHFSDQPNDDLSFEFLTNLEDVSVNGYKGIPAVSSVDAIFNLSNDDGYLDFQSDDTNLHFDELYEESWNVKALSGYVDWAKHQDVFLLKGNNLSLKKDEAKLSGSFRLEIGDDDHSWIALDLHGSNVAAKDRLTYIPSNALDASLQEWLSRAYADIGQADSVDVLIQSELEEGASPHVRLKIEASGLDIAFDENWPVAKDVKGSFELSQEGVAVHVSAATLSDLLVNDIEISVPIENGSASWMNIKGGVTDESSLIVDVLQETPLAKTVLSPFSAWKVSGDITTRFDVAVPLVENEESDVALSIEFQDNSLFMEDLNLPSVIREGRLHFSSDTGITDSEFSVEGFGGASVLTLNSNETEEGELAITGEFSGVADVQKVAKWRELPEFVVQKTTGETLYTGLLTINKTRNGQIDIIIDTDLIGVDLDFPEPIGKQALAVKPLQLRVSLYEDDMIVASQYNQLLDAQVLLRDGQFLGGNVALNGLGGDKSHVDMADGLTVTGFLESLNIQNWLETVKSVSSKENEGVINGEGVKLPSVPSWLKHVDLIVNAVEVNPHNTWHNFKVSYDKDNEKPVYVSSDEMSVSLLEKDGLADLHFSFLSWNTDPVSEDDTDSTESSPAPLSVQQIPNMRLSVDQFYLNEQPYGDWQFVVSKEGNTVQIDPISTSLKTGKLNGRFTWLDAGEDSRVDLALDINGKDLAELTKKFSATSFVSSEKYKVNVDLGWEGHPFHFGRETLSGDISFSSENGTFHKVEELPSFLKILGIFNVGALSRRLSLDFSDVYEPGLTYDEFSGVLSAKNGIIKTKKPISVISPTAELTLEGSANVIDETLDETLTAAFPITGALPLAALIWSTPQIAGLLYITDRLFGSQISKVTSIQYKIKGPFESPSITPVRFDPKGKDD